MATEKPNENTTGVFLKNANRRAKDYFMGMLLQPWIWALGYVFITGGFILLLLLRNPGLLTLQSTDLPNELTLIHVWLISLVAILFNYSFSFYTRYKTPRLTPILFLISLNVLLVLFISLAPFFMSYFR
jgi:hypothetical protein